MSKLFNYIVAVIAIVLLSGCGTTAKFVYPAKMDDLIRFNESESTKKSVAVLPFDDYRDDTNTVGTIAFSWIPLMPWGWVTYQRPDSSRIFISLSEFDFEPNEDLAKAAALSLRRSNLFDNAFFTFGAERDSADYIFKADIISTEYLGTQYSYGLSFAGAYLWILGAPAGSSVNSLKIKFCLIDKATKAVIWEYMFNNSEKTTIGLYYNLGHDVKQYSYLMQQAMNEALTDLAEKLKK